MAKDYYSILGLSRGASVDEIKKAYRALSKELHPDRNTNNPEAEKRYKEVNEAYEILNDPEKKKMYDQFGTTGGPGMGGAGGMGGFDFNNVDFGNLGGFGDLFENFFGGRARGPRKQETQGEDIEVEVTVAFADIVSGAERRIALERFITCSECKGSGTAQGSAMKQCSECNGTGQVVRTRQSFFGTVQQSFVCPTCNGSGHVPEKPCSKCDGQGRKRERSEIALQIPAGIDDGQTLRLRGQGNAGMRGGAAGDLFVHIRVRPDARFNREGADIQTTLTVHVLDAILGAQMSVETVHGPVELKIPEGTQPSTILRIKGKGLPVLNTSRMGDHYVRIEIEVPKKLSRAERKLLEEWRAQRT